MLYSVLSLVLPYHTRTSQSPVMSYVGVNDFPYRFTIGSAPRALPVQLMFYLTMPNHLLSSCPDL